MKKLMIAALVAGLAVCSEAAVFKWTTGSVVKGVAVDGVKGNDTYSAGGKSMYNNSALTYVLTLYTQGHGGDENYKVGSTSGSVAIGTSGKANTLNMNVSEASAGVTYDFVLKLTGTEKDLAAKPDLKADGGTYSYGAAKVAWEGSGSVLANSSSAALGGTTLVPGSWDVTGITFTLDPTPTPEPTSGLLLLLGVAGLALRRKQK